MRLNGLDFLRSQHSSPSRHRVGLIALPVEAIASGIVSLMPNEELDKAVIRDTDKLGSDPERIERVDMFSVILAFHCTIAASVSPSRGVCNCVERTEQPA